MSKNIVLCADGTGNKGGYTPDSNVYKMYHAVDIHDDENPQMIFYDNGVGTAKNKYLRALGGAVGIGFGANVRDLYQYLARKYEPGDQLLGDKSLPDKVYLFGFSRGAATIRAFTGFVNACGLVDGRGLSNGTLTGLVESEFKKYRELKGREPSVRPSAINGKSHGVIDIQFVGVWDTVSALGFPERTDITSIGMWVINTICLSLSWLVNKIPRLAHKFYNYQLTDNVKFAYQALSLDDARTGFWPWVWDEHGRTSDTVEQVWFPGVHANVGGGYNRSGLANVTLEWMMMRASRHGLMLREDKINMASADAHAHGRMYDSRDGLAMFYRYHPRELGKLCHNKLLGNIKVHNSVIKRMRKRTANYAPTQLPDTFEIVETDMNAPRAIVNPAGDDQRAVDPAAIRYQIFSRNWWQVFNRKWLCGLKFFKSTDQWAIKRAATRRLILFRKFWYGLMLEATLAIVIYALYLWRWETMPDPMSCENGTGLMGYIAQILNIMLPDMFCGLITVVTLENSQIFWIVIAIIGFYFWVRSHARKNTVVVAERLRRLVMKAVNS